MYTNPYEQYSAMLGMLELNCNYINILVLQEAEGRRKDTLKKEKE